MAKYVQQQALRRLQTERKKISIEGQQVGFFACPTSDLDILQWEVFIRGSQDSPYEGVILHARMVFPTDYPMNPPKMKFITEMIHPNIYKDGTVCISILHRAGDDPTSYEKADERWSPVQSIRTIVLSVVSILNEPNPESPADVDASKKQNEDPEGYLQEVREFMKRQGMSYEKVLEVCSGLSEEEKETMKQCLFE